MLQRVIEQEQQQEKQVFDYRDWMLGKILTMVSKQRLLPGFLDGMDARCTQSKKKRLVDYQQRVKKIYRYLLFTMYVISEKSKFPLVYDAEQALTEREKLMIKIQKSQSNELEIEYFEKMRLKEGKVVPTYKGFPLESVSYPTKKQFEMFQDFSEKKFLKSYSEIFDDQLQLKQLTNILKKQKVKTIGNNAITQQKKPQKDSFSLPKPKLTKFSVGELKQKERDLKKVKRVRLRPLTEVVESERTVSVVDKVVNEKYRPHLEKITVGKMSKDASRTELYHKMLTIGSFPASVSQPLISLTKQSLVKYLKQFYERQLRIVDFIEIKQTISLDDYCNLCTKVKLMSVEHVIFMAFLYYDSNNDGYICDNDIRRIRALVKGQKNALIGEDLKIIEGIKEKKQFNQKVLALKKQGDKQLEKQKPSQNELNYHELYKLPEVTQSTYFHWLNRNRQKQKTEVPHLSQHQQQTLRSQQATQPIFKSKKLHNPFNPSVIKSKHNYFDQKAQVKKYILNIKATKTYINFWQFRKKYIQQSEETTRYNKSIIQRRATENSSRGAKQSVTKDHAQLVSGSRHRQQQLNRSMIKIQVGRKQSRPRIKEKILKPFLWYDLLNRLAGVKYQGLRYD